MRASDFVLYVEGARDRDLLRIWAERHFPDLVRFVQPAVILGGRQPNRAAEHFLESRRDEPELRGLCVLDRDHAAPEHAPLDVPGLEFFVWGRRHIESYLLVPEAIRRCAKDPGERFRLERFLRELPAADDDRAQAKLDAKRLLGRDGALAREAGRPIPVSRIARGMRRDEVHGDVLDFFARVRAIVS